MEWSASNRVRSKGKLVMGDLGAREREVNQKWRVGSSGFREGIEDLLELFGEVFEEVHECFRLQGILALTKMHEVVAFFLNISPTIG